MEQQTATPETTMPARGTPESAAWFRKQLEALGIGNSALARAMIENGDDRQFDTTVRGLRRMATGEARVSGEMRALLTMMRSNPAEGRRGRAPKPFEFILTPQEIAVLRAPADEGGHQGFHKRLMEQLAESPTVRLSDEELGELIRYTSRYGSGGFQGRLQKAFLRQSQPDARPSQGCRAASGQGRRLTIRPYARIQPACPPTRKLARHPAPE